jgi:hypothetical protein
VFILKVAPKKHNLECRTLNIAWQRESTKGR